MNASLQAWQSDQKAAKGEGFLSYPAHDLQMLVYAASFDGQSALAISAARGIAKLTDLTSVYPVNSSVIPLSTTGRVP